MTDSVENSVEAEFLDLQEDESALESPQDYEDLQSIRYRLQENRDQQKCLEIRQTQASSIKNQKMSLTRESSLVASG